MLQRHRERRRERAGGGAGKMTVEIDGKETSETRMGWLGERESKTWKEGPEPQ